MIQASEIFQLISWNKKELTLHFLNLSKERWSYFSFCSHCLSGWIIYIYWCIFKFVDSFSIFSLLLCLSSEFFLFLSLCLLVLKFSFGLSFIYLFDEIFNMSVGFNSVHICFLMHFSNTYFIVFVRIFQHLCHFGAEVYWSSLCLFPYELRVPWLFCMPSNLWLYLDMLWKFGSSLNPVKTSWWSVNLVLNGFAILNRIQFMHEQVGNVQEFKKSLWALPRIPPSPWFS